MQQEAHRSNNSTRSAGDRGQPLTSPARFNAAADAAPAMRDRSWLVNSPQAPQRKSGGHGPDSVAAQESPGCEAAAWPLAWRSRSSAPRSEKGHWPRVPFGEGAATPTLFCR